MKQNTQSRNRPTQIESTDLWQRAKTTQWSKDSLLINRVEKMEIHMEKNEPRCTLCTIHIKIDSIWITDLNVKHKTFSKTPENSIGTNLNDLEFGNDFLNTTPKMYSMREWIDRFYWWPWWSRKTWTHLLSQHQNYNYLQNNYLWEQPKN